MTRATVLGIDGSPKGGGRTKSVLEAVLEGAGGEKAPVLNLADSQASSQIDEHISLMDRADGLVIGSPIYRASYSGLLKAFFDQVPRGIGEDPSPLRGKPVVIVATGASLHHFLALNDLRNILSSFFAAVVLPPGIYVPHDGFNEAGQLLRPYAELATETGGVLDTLASFLRTLDLRIEPQV